MTMTKFTSSKVYTDFHEDKITTFSSKLKAIVDVIMYVTK